MTRAFKLLYRLIRRRTMRGLILSIMVLSGLVFTLPMISHAETYEECMQEHEYLKDSPLYLSSRFQYQVCSKYVWKGRPWYLICCELSLLSVITRLVPCQSVAHFWRGVSDANTKLDFLPCSLDHFLSGMFNSTKTFSKGPGCDRRRKSGNYERLSCVPEKVHRPRGTCSVRTLQTCHEGFLIIGSCESGDEFLTFHPLMNVGYC